MKIVTLFAAILATIALGRMEDMIPGTICKGKTGMDLAVCYSNAACMYMNQIRQRNGLPPMAFGTEAMLKNAMTHNKVQSRSGGLFHQSMGGKLGRGQCTTTLSAENVAMFQDSRVNNPAAQCTKQWRDSPGHFRNMMSRTSKVCAVGIYKDNAGSWWCTQTFSWDNPDKKCRMQGRGTKPASPANPVQLYKPVKPVVPKRPRGPSAAERRRRAARQAAKRRAVMKAKKRRAAMMAKKRRAAMMAKKRRAAMMVKKRGAAVAAKKRRAAMNRRTRRTSKCMVKKVIASQRIYGRPAKLVKYCKSRYGRCMCNYCLYIGRMKRCFPKAYLPLIKRYFGKRF